MLILKFILEKKKDKKEFHLRIELYVIVVQCSYDLYSIAKHSSDR